MGVLFLFSLFSCSLKYDQSVNAEETNPEFVFTHANLIRYENGSESVRVYADNIEQYKNSDITYGKNITFTTYDDENKIETEGSCGYLYADSENELYEMYDGIKIYNKSDNTNFFANMLKWNGKNEQLTGGKLDTARIENALLGDTSITTFSSTSLISYFSPASSFSLLIKETVCCSPAAISETIFPDATTVPPLT